jgi:hypothetical protein
MMKHVTMVDESTVQYYRQKWSFVHPSVLSGRKLRRKKRKIEAAAATVTGDCKAGSGSGVPSNVGANPPSDSATSTASKMDDAKARFLKRKLEKAGK